MELGYLLLILGIGLIIFSMEPGITGGAIGVPETGIYNVPMFLAGLFLIPFSINFRSGDDSLEAIVVPTGPTEEIDKERAKGGAKSYLDHEHKDHHHDVVIVSGEFNKGRFFGSQSNKIYRALRRSGVPREDIILESHSGNTIENVLYTCEILEDKGIHEVTVVTDKGHASRFKMLFERAKKEGYAPRDLVVHTFSEGLSSSYSSIKSMLAYAKDKFSSLRKHED